MKPIIGIINRNSLSKTKKKIGIIYSDIVSAIIKSGGIPIGINNIYFDYYLNICSGFILEGGDDVDKRNYHIIKKCYDKNIPLLGICLGMQEIGLYFDGIEKDIPNHLNVYHKIYINKNSLLSKIINTKDINVNSRHTSTVINPKINISSKSSDNINESFEDNRKRFFLGIAWHPETTYKKDIYSRHLFNYFIKKCYEYKKERRNN